MSDGWTAEKEKTSPRKRSEWLIDSGLVFIYSLFITGCFFALMRYRNNVILLAVLSSLSLACFCISYVLYNLERTLKILFFASLLGCILASIVIAFIVYYYRSYPEYIIRYGEVFFINNELEKTQEVAEYLTMFVGFITFVLTLSILGAIAGDYIAEKRKW